MLDSIKNIELYYKNLTEEKSYEALKVVPLILDLLGRNFKSDPDSFWLSLEIFLKIMCEVGKRNIKKITNLEIENLYKILSKNSAQIMFEGVKDKSFFKTFNDVKSHINYVPLLANLMGKNMHLFIYNYLSNSGQLKNVFVVDYILDVVFEKSYDFIYSLVATEIFLKVFGESEGADLKKQIENEEDEENENKEESEKEKDRKEKINKVYNLFIFLDFVEKKHLIGKTEIFILKSILGRKK